MNNVHLMALLLSSATLVACGGGDGAAKAEGSGSPAKKTVAPTSPITASLDAALEAAKKEEALLEERAKAVAELEAKIKKDSEALALEKEAASKLEEGEAKVAALQAVKEKEAALEELKKSLEAASPKKKDGAAEGSDSEEEDAASPSPKKKAEETPVKPVVATLTKEVLEGVAGKLEAAAALKDEKGNAVSFDAVKGAAGGQPKTATNLTLSIDAKKLKINADELSSKPIVEAVEEVRGKLIERAYFELQHGRKTHAIGMERVINAKVVKDGVIGGDFSIRPVTDKGLGDQIRVSMELSEEALGQMKAAINALTLEVLGLSADEYEFTADGKFVAKSEVLASTTNTPKSKTPAAKTPVDTTGKKGAATPKSARKKVQTPGEDKFGEFVAFGETIQVNAPVYASLKGELSAKESNVLGTMFYGANGALFGIAQAYVNGAEGFALGGKQLETSAVSAFMAGNAFVEFQSGVVEASKVNGGDFSGSRQQVVVGYDFTSGLTPFLQFGARQLSEGKVAHSEKSGYAGLTFESEKKNSFFGYASSITAKTGAVVSNVHGTSADSALFVEQGFTTTEGLKLDAVMSVSSKESTSFKVSVGFSR